MVKGPGGLALYPLLHVAAGCWLGLMLGPGLSLREEIPKYFLQGPGVVLGLVGAAFADLIPHIRTHNFVRFNFSRIVGARGQR